MLLCMTAISCCAGHVLYTTLQELHAVMYQMALWTLSEVVSAETIPANTDLLQTPQKLCL